MTRYPRHHIPPEDSPGEPSARALTGESHDVLMARLYLEHNQALVRFLMTRVDSEQEAQDVAHEAYVRMLQLDTQGAVSYLSAYLFRTAANIAIDRIRRGRRGQLVQRSLTQDAGIDRASVLGAPPDRQLASRQELELIARYAEELPPKCRQAFYLHRIEDMSLDEIASQLGVTKRMVHHYLMRAMVHCRARLDGVAGPAGS
jgi:RNA polymerase sigma factor (sigma-70 family)